MFFIYVYLQTGTNKQLSKVFSRDTISKVANPLALATNNARRPNFFNKNNRKSDV